MNIFLGQSVQLEGFLMNSLKHSHKTPLTGIYLENRSYYFTPLEDTQDMKDITAFRKVMFDQTTEIN